MADNHSLHPQEWNKWLAVFLITGAIAASGIEGVGTDLDPMMIVGLCATLIAAVADAAMYMFAEKVFNPAPSTTAHSYDLVRHAGQMMLATPVTRVGFEHTRPYP